MGISKNHLRYLTSLSIIDETIVILLGHRSISPNAAYPPDSQVSPLHLAASLGRTDIVSLLLEQPEIDASVKDAQGRTVLDVATKEAKEVIQGARAQSVP